MKLLHHIKAMQARAGLYMSPEGYVPLRDHPEGSPPLMSDVDRKDAFIADMIYLLDGPEQREAEHLAGEMQDDMDQLTIDLKVTRDRLAVSESDKGRATAALGEERKIQNDLRTLLFNSEMRYAKLVGYVEGRKDAEPPRMVPEQREGFLAQMPDASGVSTGWRNDASHWFHRS